MVAYLLLQLLLATFPCHASIWAECCLLIHRQRLCTHTLRPDTEMKGVHVLGAGSIGILFAHHIAATGTPCTLLLRTADQLNSLRTLDNFVTVDETTADGTSTSSQQRVQAEVVTPLALQQQQQQRDSSISQHIQQLILTTKANQAVHALAAVKHRLCKDSVVVLLQNGVLGVYVQAVQQLFRDPSNRPAFLLGSTTHGAYRRSAFHVVHGSSGHGTCVFGLPSVQLQSMAQSLTADQQHSQCLASNGIQDSAELSGLQDGASSVAAQQQQQRAQDMLAVLNSLQQLHPNTSLSPDVLHQQLLLKLLVNCCANPLSALLHCRNGGLIDSVYTEAIWRGVIAECKQVFGDMLQGSEQELYEKVHHVVKINSTNYNSMLQDVVHKSATEVDYLNGFVVRQGAMMGVATPVNEMLTTLVKAREDVPVEYLTRETM